MASPHRDLSQSPNRKENQDSSRAEDGDFELTSEMMLQDEIDDETSLLEEEGMENDEAVQEEVSALEKESEMPLEELLALYGGAANEEEDFNEGEEAEERQSGGDKEEEKEKKEHKNKISSVSVRLVSQDITVNGNDRMKLLTGKLLESKKEDDGESSSDDEYVPLDNWKKEIKVGEEYQAVVPDAPDSVYVEPDSVSDDQLLWDSNRVDSKEVDSYLATTVWNLPREREGIEALPLVAIKGDSERALYLLKECDYDVNKALETAGSKGGGDSTLTSQSTDSGKKPWTEDDCRSFEIGMQLYGKDFPAIQRNRLSDRTVGELIEYYYLWKKTEMHDIFVQQVYQNPNGSDYINPGQLDGLDKYGEADFESSRAQSRTQSRGPSPLTIRPGENVGGTHLTVPSSEPGWRVKIDGRKRKIEKDGSGDDQDAKRRTSEPLERDSGRLTTASPITTVESLLTSETLPESSDDSFHENKPH